MRDIAAMLHQPLRVMSEPASSEIGRRRSIVVCVPLRWRENRFGGLAAALAALVMPDRVSVRFVFVENDEARRYERLVNAFSRSLSHSVEYAMCPDVGFAHVRNHLLSRALEVGADFVAMLDDDEVPNPGWLVELMACHARTGADVVGGPVLPIADDRTISLAGRAYIQDRMCKELTARRAIHCRTNNCLISAALLRETGIRFDERFNLSGGEDTDFFCRLRDHGAAFAWTHRAAVEEELDPERLTGRAIGARFQRMAMNHARRRLEADGSDAVLHALLPRLIERTAIGLVMLPLAVFPVGRIRLLVIEKLYSAYGIFCVLRDNRSRGGKSGSKRSPMPARRVGSEVAEPPKRGSVLF